MNKITKPIQREAPVILSIMGIGGFVTAAVMAVKATPKANNLLEEVRVLEENVPYEDGGWPLVDKAKLLFPVYAPAIAMGLISAGFVMAGITVSKRRYYALSVLYSVSERTVHAWQEKVLESVGPKKFDEISAKVATPTEPEMFTVLGDDVLFFDTFSGRYFTSESVEKVRQHVNDLNETLYSDMYVSVNDFYYEVGLPQVTYGNDIGWSIERGSIGIKFDATLTPNDRPCVSVTFMAGPKHIYDRLLTAHNEF